MAFLAARALLVGSDPESLVTPDVWRDMLSRFAAWYNLPTPAVPEGDYVTRADITQTLATLLDQANDAIMPVALIAANDRRANDLAFLALIRNDGVFPRLIVMRPPAEQLDLSRLRNVLPAIESCAYQVDNYIYAPSTTARRLFLAHNDAVMYITYSQPEPLANNWLQVPQGEEVSFFEYDADTLANVSAYAAVFEGRGPGVMTLMTLIPQVRTNMNPSQIIQFLNLN